MTLWEISDETVLDIIVCEQNRLCSRCVYSLRQLSARGDQRRRANGLGTHRSDLKGEEGSGFCV